MNMSYSVQSAAEVERKAREMGMLYPDEIKVIEAQPQEVEND
ncbi:hypothetical protein [Gudongella oleilytica]|jgi:hypothetical protein|nr:hypothetical protein [Gudongella oleilytica]MDY0256578.1 hypothetical protein [Gudongella oleilytica]